MSYPIKFLSLQKAELEYEVALRGGTTGETVQELRKQIVELAAKQLSEEILESHLEPAVDLAQVTETLAKIKLNLDSLDNTYDRNVFLRTQTMLNHLYYRLIRIVRSEVVAEVYDECFKKHKQYSDELKHYKETTPTSNTDPLSDLITVSCEKRMVSDVISKLKYSGKTCPRAFIQKAEEFMLSRNIPREKLLAFAYEIFTDDALHWFRCIKENVSSWDVVVALLKQDFSHDDYDYRLLSEIRMRTQGEH
ncbi:hypothetical protein NE865_16308 [Phthorimaea operculella]|nr:hypothetical protein NE865_16308 [Phthorimaea operculella]